MALIICLCCLPYFSSCKFNNISNVLTSSFLSKAKACPMSELDRSWLGHHLCWGYWEADNETQWGPRGFMEERSEQDWAEETANCETGWWSLLAQRAAGGESPLEESHSGWRCRGPCAITLLGHCLGLHWEGWGRLKEWTGGCQPITSTQLGEESFQEG